MNKTYSLYQELINEKNRYLSDEDSFQLVGIFNNLLFTLVIIILLVTTLLMIYNTITIIPIPLSINDIMSVCLGNVAFYYSFKLVKNKVIPYYSNNPIMLIGIIYPAFFNATLVQSLISINPIIKIIILFLSMCVYYLILNKYYQVTYYQNKH